MLLLAGMMLATSTFAQGQVSPTSPIHNADGKVVGFNTNDPGTYFLIPGAYLLAQRDSPPPAYLTAAGNGSDGQTLYDLRLVFTPSYAHAAAPVTSIRAANSQSLFFPLPMFIDEVRLFLPSALGSVVAQLTPDDALNTPYALYYRLRLTQAQVTVLQALARSGLTLQGIVGTTYSVPGGEQYSSVPITLILPASTFSSTLPPQTARPEQWLKDLMDETQLYSEGALDGRYSLGGATSVTFRDSLVQGSPLSGAFNVQSVGPGLLAVVATASPNMEGEARFYVTELGLWIVMTYQATFEAQLDLFMMEIQLTRFSVNSVQVNGSNSPFYTRLLEELLKKPETQQELAAALTYELQERILAHTLFGVDLP